MEALKCEICGGQLALDALNDLFHCQYCGSMFPREKVAEEIPHDGPAAPPTSGAVPLEQLIEKGRTLLDLGVYDKARQIFRRAADDYPEDYRGWWYCFLCDTKSMTEVRPSKDVLYKTKELEYAFRIAPKDVQPELLKQYRAYALQCMKKGCEIEMESLAAECCVIDADVQAHKAALAKVGNKLKMMKVTKYVAIASFLLFFPTVFCFILPGPWILLALPMIFLESILLIAAIVILLVGARNGGLIALHVEAQSKAKDMLAQIGRSKKAYLHQLRKHYDALPRHLERLTIADVLNQKKYTA